MVYGSLLYRILSCEIMYTSLDFVKPRLFRSQDVRNVCIHLLTENPYVLFLQGEDSKIIIILLFALPVFEKLIHRDQQWCDKRNCRMPKPSNRQWNAYYYWHFFSCPCNPVGSNSLDPYVSKFSILCNTKKFFFDMLGDHIAHIRYLNVATVTSDVLDYSDLERTLSSAKECLEGTNNDCNIVFSYHDSVRWASK